MKNKKILIIIICIIIVFLIVKIISSKKRYNEVENVQFSTSNVIEQDTNTIEQIKNEINATANTDMYQIEEEYDGRKIIQIKPDIQFDTVLAGILKEDRPKEKEIEIILKNRPTKGGIWISNQSRKKFLKILEENNLSGFNIDEEGYLYETKENNSKLKDAINSDKLYILDLSGTCYERDEISGEIVEYPFEDMEPNQILEIYINGNSSILEITSNSRGKISNKEILDEVLMNLE